MDADKNHRAMKTIKIIKIAGLTTVTLLFTTLLSAAFHFEATHKVVRDIITPTSFNILQVDTILITTLCTTYSLLLLPWLYYFLKIEKKSGLQYFSLYPMTAGKASKIASILLTLLNAITAIGFYLLYLNYLKNITPKESEGQISILTTLCCGIIFWGGTYLIYGSIYGTKRVKAIIKKKREKRRERREANATTHKHKQHRL